MVAGLPKDASRHSSSVVLPAATICLPQHAPKKDEQEEGSNSDKLGGKLEAALAKEKRNLPPLPPSFPCVKHHLLAKSSSLSPYRCDKDTKEKERKKNSFVSFTTVFTVPPNSAEQR